MEYTFSFYHKVKKPKIVHPKWWQFRKKAKLVWCDSWKREVVTLVTNDYKFLSDHEVRELLKTLFRNMNGMQLEIANKHTSYIATDGSIIEDPATNLLTNTD